MGVNMATPEHLLLVCGSVSDVTFQFLKCRLDDGARNLNSTRGQLTLTSTCACFLASASGHSCGGCLCNQREKLGIESISRLEEACQHHRHPLVSFLLSNGVLRVFKHISSLVRF